MSLASKLLGQVTWDKWPETVIIKNNKQAHYLAKVENSAHPRGKILRADLGVCDTQAGPQCSSLPEDWVCSLPGCEPCSRQPWSCCVAIGLDSTTLWEKWKSETLLFSEAPGSSCYKCQKRAETERLKQVVKINSKREGGLICVGEDCNCKGSEETLKP